MCGKDVVEIGEKVKVHGRNEIKQDIYDFMLLNFFFFIIFRRQCANIEQVPKDIYL
jgi:hypothetical protein